MARKQSTRKSVDRKKSAEALKKPGIDAGALDEQELNKVTGGTDPGESVSFNFGQIKPQY